MILVRMVVGGRRVGGASVRRGVAGAHFDARTAAAVGVVGVVDGSVLTHVGRVRLSDGRQLGHDGRRLVAEMVAETRV